MMKFLSGAAVCVSIMLLVPCVAMAENGGAGAIFLTIAPGARSAAMGTAYTAVTQDIGAIYYNPAALARLERREVMFEHQQRFADITLDYLSLSLHHSPALNLALSAIYLDAGTFQVRTIDNPAGAGSFGANDLALSLTASRKFSRSVSAGATVKFIQQTIASNSAQAVAVDFGLHSRRPGAPLAFGFSLSNLGPDITFISEGDPLPVTVRGGVEYDLGFGQNRRRNIKVTGDLVKEYDRTAGVNLGAQWQIIDALAARIGYSSLDDLDHGFSFGLGFKYDDLYVDYAYIPAGNLASINQFSAGYRFGPRREEPVEAVAPRPEISRPVPPRTAQPLARKLYVYPVGQNEKALWNEVFMTIAGDPAVELTDITQSDYRLNLQGVSRLESGLWIGTVHVEDSRGRMMEEIALLPSRDIRTFVSLIHSWITVHLNK